LLIAILLTSFSIFVKFSNVNHGLPNWTTNDLQHVVKAFHLKPLYQEVRKGSGSARAEFKRRLSSKHKYPYGLSRLYLFGSNFFSDDDPGFSSLISMASVARIVNLILMVVMFGFLFLLPTENHLKWGAALMLATSFYFHHFSLTCHIHTAVGYLVFASYFFAVLALKVKYKIFALVMSSLFAGYAAGSVFTGVFALLPVLLAIYLLYWKQAKNKKLTFGALFVCSFMFLSVLVINYPAFIYGADKGFSSIFVDGMAPFLGQSENSGFALSFDVYFYDLFHLAPFMGVLVLTGVYYLFKNREWREPFWLLTLAPLVCYLVFMGFIYSHGSRHLMLVMPLLALLGSYGVACLWKRFDRRVLFLVLPVLLFNVLSIQKHISFSQRDTRLMAYHHIMQNLDVKERILLDGIGPALLWRMKVDGYEPRSVLTSDKATVLRLFAYYAKDFHALGINKENCFEPENIHRLVEALGLNYYVSNSYWQSRAQTIDTSVIREKATLIKAWYPFEAEPLEGGSNWPNDTTALIWKIWILDAPGPVVELYDIKP
jgi:hypothetical protein